MNGFPGHQQAAFLHRIADLARGGAPLPAATTSMAGTTSLGFSRPLAARAGTTATSPCPVAAAGLGNAGGGGRWGGGRGDEVLEGTHRTHRLDQPPS